MCPKSDLMRHLLISFIFAVLLPSTFMAQSRWNNYFVAHFNTIEATAQDLVDSLAQANGWTRTFHTPSIGHVAQSIDYPYEESDIYSPLSSLNLSDSILTPGRAIVLGAGNGRIGTPVLEEVQYEPSFSPELSWQYFQYLAVECVDADYYQVVVPASSDVFEAIEIIQARPSFASENWYFNIDGFAVVTSACMQYGYGLPLGTSCSSELASNLATEATEFVSGFIQNTTGVSWFPFVLSMNSNTAAWEWQGCNGYDSQYNLGEVAPSTGCDIENVGIQEYWSCDTVYVACPDVDNNNLIGIGDIIDVLSVYGNPYDCSEQE